MIKPEDARELSVKKADRIIRRLCKETDKFIERTAKRKGLTYVILKYDTSRIHPKILNDFMTEYENQGYKIEYNDSATITISWAEDEKEWQLKEQ